MKHLFFVVFFLLLITGCSTDDEPLLCETGPVIFPFEVVEKSSGENVLPLYQDNQVSIENAAGEPVDYTIKRDINVVNLLLGWEDKSEVYTVDIGQDI